MLEVKARCTKTGDVTILKVKKGTPMNEIFNQYAKQKNHDPSKLAFKMKETGSTVDPGATVESLRASSTSEKKSESKEEGAPKLETIQPGMTAEDDEPGFCNCLN